MFIVSGLEFNFIEESPVEFDFYDFNSGLMYSNTMNAKNMYDSSYNTNVVVSGENNQFATKTNFLTGDTNLIGHLSAEVHNSRYYIDVNSDVIIFYIMCIEMLKIMSQILIYNLHKMLNHLTQTLTLDHGI